MNDSSLWSHAAFRRLWSAYTISRFGTGITFLALPILAAVILEATPAQMGLLSAAGTLPFLLFGLPAGVWVDRLRRRPILIATDIGRALLLTAVPLLTWQGVLRMEWLYPIAFINGVLTLFFDISEEAFLPAVIGRKRLTEGYSKLAASESIIELSGPVVAGGIITLLTAPFALLIDALTFVVSAVLLGTISTDEKAMPRGEKRPSFLTEIKKGLDFVRHHAQLRPLLATGATMQLFGGMVDALLILYLTDELGLSAAFIGVIFAVGSLTGLGAAALAQKLRLRIGLGRMIILGSLLIGVGSLGRPLAFGTPLMAMTILLIGQAISGFGNSTFNIAASSLTQTVTPDELLGRVNATDLFIGYGALPIGALIGGWLGGQIGLRLSLVVSSSGTLLAFLWAAFSALNVGVGDKT